MRVAVTMPLYTLRMTLLLPSKLKDVRMYYNFKSVVSVTIPYYVYRYLYRLLETRGVVLEQCCYGCKGVFSKK